MRSGEDILSILRQHSEDMNRRFHVSRVGVFGSYARGDATSESDVDIIVEFDQPIGWEIVDLKIYLEALLNMRVDLVSAGAIRRKPRLWAAVEEDLVYA